MDEKFKSILNGVNKKILVSKDMDLVEDGIIDSLQIMILVSKLEAAYSCYIAPKDIVQDNFESVEAIWKMVERCRK